MMRPDRQEEVCSCRSAISRPPSTPLTPQHDLSSWTVSLPPNVWPPPDPWGLLKFHYCSSDKRGALPADSLVWNIDESSAQVCSDTPTLSLCPCSTMGGSDAGVQGPVCVGLFPLQSQPNMRAQPGTLFIDPRILEPDFSSLCRQSCALAPLTQPPDYYRPGIWGGTLKWTASKPFAPNTAWEHPEGLRAAPPPSPFSFPQRKLGKRRIVWFPTHPRSAKENGQVNVLCYWLVAH